MTPEKFAVLSLVLLPPVLLLSAWASMQLRKAPPKREFGGPEDLAYLQRCVGAFRLLCLAIQEKESRFRDESNR